VEIEKAEAMANSEQLSAVAEAIRAGIADPERITLVGPEPQPRFELFHAASSLCSQKVRAVLHEKRLSYRSNDMIILCSMGAAGIVAAEHYAPAYVRLRLQAGRELNQALVSGYSGRTSVQSEGFDPCVVPMLIDYQAGRVIVDSMRICLYLEAVSREPLCLLPEDEAEGSAVLRQMSIVDTLPNGALLYGFHPDADRRPDILKAVMGTVYDYKIMALEAMIAANADDPELVAAYRAKIAKESGGRQVCHDAGFQRQARENVAGLLADLEQALAAQASPWLSRHGFSMADLVWGVNLIRMAYLGLASMWDTLPHVSRYFEALIQRPSLREEAIESSIRSLPPSSYLNALVAQRMASTAL